MNNRILTTILAAIVAAAMGAPTAQAVVNGQADEGKHPWVGALVSHDPETGERYLICTGTLISEKVFLTAAHCLLDEPTDFMEVSFDSFVGAPDVGPDVKLYRGKAFGHPEFVDETAPGDTHDIAVVVLDKKVKKARTARLPREDLMDRLVDWNVANRINYMAVGYGREGYDAEEDSFFGGGSRRFAFSGFGSLEPFKLNTSQVATEGEGGTCRGDSGGPIFLRKTRTVVGIVSDGDPLCQESGVNYRVDTASARAFLDDFVKVRR